MRKTILTTCLLLYFSSFVLSQKEKDSSRHSKIDFNYKLAVQYKDGRGVEMDYVKAFNYFLEAANLGDAQSVYAIAYMYYKGLGCKQNYDTAALLFREGAALEKENSLYFYGLCWRNGYGLPKNEDSAKYYLNKAAALNYKQAALELQSIIGENSNDSAAAALVQQIHNAAISDKTVFNHFKKITPHLHAIDIVVGDYSGWLLQYDWSGSHIVSSKKLQLNINADNNSLTGQWIEDRGDTAKIRASLAEDSLLFNDTKYKRKDHYSMENGVLYKFRTPYLS
jgi:TPR repeat protein